MPPRPGPDDTWAEGYQYPVNGHYKWNDGYWTRPPYEGAYWVEPYHADGQYYAGGVGTGTFPRDGSVRVR